MGEQADALIYQWDGNWYDCYDPEDWNNLISFVESTKCYYCKQKMKWKEIEGKWRLTTKTGKLHLCWGQKCSFNKKGEK